MDGRWKTPRFNTRVEPRFEQFNKVKRTGGPFDMKYKQDIAFIDRDREYEGGISETE